MDKDSDFIIRSRFFERDGELIRAIKLLTQLIQEQQENQPKNKESLESLHSSLIRCLSYYEYSLVRLSSSHDVQHSELSDYKRQQAERRELMENTKSQIEKLKQSLEQETVRRKQLEEREELLEEIHQFPSRDETNKLIETVKGEMAALTEESRELSDQLMKREEQYTTLINLIENTKKEWDEQDQINESNNL
jgi:hypothetical protein